MFVDARGINILVSPVGLRAEKLAILALERNESPPLSELEVLIDSLGPGLIAREVSPMPMPMPIRNGLTDARLAPPAKAELVFVDRVLEAAAGEASVPDEDGEPVSNFRSYGAGAILRRLALRDDWGPMPDSRRDSRAVSVIEMMDASPMAAVRADDDAVGLSRRDRDEVDAEGMTGWCRLSAKGDDLELSVGSPVGPRRDELPGIGEDIEAPSSETVFRLEIVWAVRCRNAFQSFC